MCHIHHFLIIFGHYPMRSSEPTTLGFLLPLTHTQVDKACIFVALYKPLHERALEPHHLLSLVQIDKTLSDRCFLIRRHLSCAFLRFCRSGDGSVLKFPSEHCQMCPFPNFSARQTLGWASLVAGASWHPFPLPTTPHRGMIWTIHVPPTWPHTGRSCPRKLFFESLF
jgi:hypothetical protein